MSTEAYNVNSRPRVIVRGDTMAISGTRPTPGTSGDPTISLEDLTNDAQLALALEGTRFDRARQVLKRNPQVKYVTGHSLGGSVAIALARDNPRLKAVTFNPGVPPRWAAKWTAQGLPSNVTIHRTRTDPVSALGAPWAHNRPARHADMHGIQNFW